MARELAVESYRINKTFSAYIKSVDNGKDSLLFQLSIKKGNNSPERIGSSMLSLSEARGRLEGFFYAITEDKLKETRKKSGWSQSYLVEQFPVIPSIRTKLHRVR